MVECDAEHTCHSVHQIANAGSLNCTRQRLAHDRPEGFPVVHVLVRQLNTGCGRCSRKIDLLVLRALMVVLVVVAVRLVVVLLFLSVGLLKVAFFVFLSLSGPSVVILAQARTK